MPEPFAWDVRQWKTLSDFEAYLTTVADPLWITELILHHTWKPVPATWRGLRTMADLKIYYRDQVPWYDDAGKLRHGWWSGPNLFVCLEAPDPADNGIFQGTPITQQGTHAGPCNSLGVGVEVVWNGDEAPFPADLNLFVLGVFEALAKWSDVPASKVRGHRECGSPKTCPGSKVNVNTFRSQLADRLKPSAPNNESYWAQWGTEYPLPFEQRVYGIPSAWNPITLGKAKSWAVYGPIGTVTQLFERGMIWYRDGKAHTVLYKDLK